MKALADRVMIEPAQGNVIEDEGLRVRKVEGSGVLRPEQTIQMRPNEGIVRDIGPKGTLGLIEGDRVLFRWWTGIELTLNGRQTVLTEEKNVLAKVEDGDRIEVG
jgi:co-chaperonin GroES (HSP10)